MSLSHDPSPRAHGLTVLSDDADLFTGRRTALSRIDTWLRDPESSALAVTGSALLFALAHHAGSPGEPFTWFAFIFRWMAGVFFAWVFILRGFGIAVGTHTMYDILVGWIA